MGEVVMMMRQWDEMVVMLFVIILKTINHDEPGWEITEGYVLMIIVILIPMLKILLIPV